MRRDIHSVFLSPVWCLSGFILYSWWNLKHETNVQHFSSCDWALLMQISTNDAHWALKSVIRAEYFFFPVYYSPALLVEHARICDLNCLQALPFFFPRWISTTNVSFYKQHFIGFLCYRPLSHIIIQMYFSVYVARIVDITSYCEVVSSMAYEIRSILVCVDYWEQHNG